MSGIKARLKKLSVLLISVAAVSMVSSPALMAQSEALLQQIATNTYNTYTAVNNIPVWLGKISEMAQAFLDPDDSDATKNIQSKMASYTSQSVQSLKLQNAISKDQDIAQPIQPLLIQDLFQGITEENVPNANDLMYQSFLGMKYFPTDPRSKGENPTQVNSPYNFIRFAAGLGLEHVIPNPIWRGNAQARTAYTGLFDTIKAIQSFSLYTLSGLYADSLNNNSLSKTQQDLLTQASNSEWFAQIASEKIGFVVRQILMYNSQMFVLMSQMFSVQKQMLATQAMTNTLLITLNQQNEDLAFKKASGEIRQ